VGKCILVRKLWLVIVVLLLSGCGSRRSLPALPEVETSRFLSAVRQPIEQALADAKTKPIDPEANGRLGMVLHANGQLAAARVCYERAAILDPKRFDWAYYLGTAQLSDGKSAEAVTTLRRALEIRPQWLPAELKLLQALIDSGRTEEANRSVIDILKRNPNDPTVNFLYARVSGAPEYYEKAVAAFPQYGAAIFALAQHYQRIGRAEDAGRLMAQYPQFKTVSPPVEDSLMDAVDALKSGSTELLRQAANLEAQGQLSKAAELNEKALGLDPNLTQAHINLISAYARLGDATKAEEHYNLAIKQNPNAAEAYYNFGVLCYATNRKREAKQAFERTIKIDSGKGEAHANLGSLLQEEGKLQEAAKEFLKAIELQPDNRVARFHLGRIFANEGRYDDALGQFSRIMTPEDDSTPTYLYAMGATYARAGRVSDAVATLDRARSKALERGQAAVAESIERDLARLKK
jgi:tetratricopeptide (TPR) repeat protein